MKRLLVLFLLLCGLSLTAKAERRFIALEDLLRDSDLIVVGTLHGLHEYSENGVDYGRGEIEVHEVLWRQAQIGASITLKWQNPQELVCPRVTHRSHADQQALWLLNRNPDASVAADYPGRFVSLAERKKVEDLLQRGIFFTGGSFKATAPFIVKVLYRNASNTARQFPSLAYRAGRLHLPPNSSLTACGILSDATSNREITMSLASHMVADDTLPLITVPPNSQTTLEFDLKQLFNAPTRHYSICDVTLSLAGIAAANQARIYVAEDN